MKRKEINEFCVTPKKGALNWRVRVAKNVLKRYRDIVFSSTKGVRTITKNGQVIFGLLSPPINSPQGRRRMRTLYKDIISEKTVIKDNKILKWGSRSPHIASVATTYNCQCNCHHCSAYHYREMKSEKCLTKEEIASIFKQLTELGTTTIITGGGEALTRKDFPEIVASLDKSKATITLFTNGELLTDEVAYKLQQSGIFGVYVSIDSASPEKHNQLRQRPGLFEKAVKAIENCQNNDVPVGIATLCTKESIYSGDLEKVIELGKKLDVFEIFVLDIIATGKIINNPEVMLSKEEKMTVSKIMGKYTNNKEYPNLIHESMLFELAYPCVEEGCPAGTTMLHINPDGTVSPCNLMPLFYGDTRKEPLADIWERMINDEPFVNFHRHCRMVNPEWRNKYLLKETALTSVNVQN